MKILISPFAQKLRNGKENAKDFPYWSELVSKLLDSGFDVIQIGSSKDSPIKYNIPSHNHAGKFEFRQNVKLKDIAEIVKNECHIWISVDSFLQHLCAYYELKRGIVIFSQSDPQIFGYKHNINMLKDRKYLRKEQMWIWEQCEYNKEAFVTAEDVYKAVLKELQID